VTAWALLTAAGKYQGSAPRFQPFFQHRERVVPHEPPSFRAWAAL